LPRQSRKAESFCIAARPDQRLPRHLAAALVPTGSLTRSSASVPSQTDVVRSFEVLRQLVAPSVMLDAWFGAG
jgi:hypothetical protein